MTCYGLFPGEVTHEARSLLVNGTALQFSSETDPAKIPWGQAGVDVVIESTGALRGPNLWGGGRPEGR